MYHNEGGGKFRDVSSALGFTREGWAQGVCAGDYDNDGYTDLFVTYWGQNALSQCGWAAFRGCHCEGPSPRSAFGITPAAPSSITTMTKLDLFVANYLKFDFDSTPKPGANPYCFYRGIAVNCSPRGLSFDRNLLYHNEGAVFRDVSDASGISKPDANYSLGVLTGDFNDGLTDIYVASDRTPSILYINQETEVRGSGAAAGVALDENGGALPAWVLRQRAICTKGSLDIPNQFSDELSTLYRNRSQGEFQDVSVEAGWGETRVSSAGDAGSSISTTMAGPICCR